MTAPSRVATPATNMPRLRPYQATVARAILERVASGEGGAISVEIARQGGKNELSAQVELVLLLTRAARGGAIVKCAPTFEPQAVLSRDRLLARAREAGLDGLVERDGAAHVRCGRAGARFLSAEPSANVLGHTADLLLEVDEAQDVRPEKFDRDFRPMAAAANAPVVYYGTPWGPRSLLAQAQAAHLEAERADGRRRHFRYDWERVAASNPAYGRYVEDERARLGERHPLFRTQYLLEALHDQDRLLDGAALAQLDGRHERLRAPLPTERYVAGLDLAGPVLEGREGSGSANRDWTVLTIARLRPRPRGLPAIEVVEHQAWRGAATDPLVDALADRLRRQPACAPARRRRDRPRRARRRPAHTPAAGGTRRAGRVQRRAQVAARLRAARGRALRPAPALPQRRLRRGCRVPPPARARPGRLPRRAHDAVLRRPRRRPRRLRDEPRPRRRRRPPRGRRAHRARARIAARARARFRAGRRVNEVPRRRHPPREPRERLVPGEAPREPRERLAPEKAPREPRERLVPGEAPREPRERLVPGEAPREPRERLARANALPEHVAYRDRGCDIFPSCLHCPLPRCRYDEPGGVRALLNRERDREIRRLRLDHELPVDEIAMRFRVSRRTVFRALQHGPNARPRSAGERHPQTEDSQP